MRTPNHECSPAQKLVEALKDQVRFYFMHQPDAEKDQRITYEMLFNDRGLADLLSFSYDADTKVFTKMRGKEGAVQASLQTLSTDAIVLCEGKGDQYTIHKNPLTMQIAMQYAPQTHIYEMGRAHGAHLHALGGLILNDKEVDVGGHVLGFSDMQS